MYGLSGEHLLIVLVILLIFGPRRLPGLGHSIGRTMKNFKDGLAGVNENEGPGAAKPTQQIAPKTSEKASPVESAENAEVAEREKEKV